MTGRMEKTWEVEEDLTRKSDLLGTILYSTISYCNALQGNEGFMADLGGMRSHLERGKFHPKHPHCVAPLLGCFKGEDGKRYHLLLMANESHSGI